MGADVLPELSDKESQEGSEGLLFADAHERGVDPEFYAKIQVINRGIQEMGFGWYQWKVVIAAGIGWYADNMWLQALSMLMPNVQYEFDQKGQIPHDAAVHVKETSICLYAGAMVGAVVWGILADTIGRYKVWNATLFWSGIFGIAAGGTKSFTQFGAMMSMIGFGVGGNFPVDGAMCIEYLPGAKQNMLTLLTVSFSLGPLIASLIGWGFIATYSKNCTDPSMGGQCYPEDNNGWRYTYYTLGCKVIFFGILRLFVFGVDESPKYLVSSGQFEKAYDVIRKIARANKKEVPFTLQELRDAGNENKRKGTSEGLSAKERILENVHNLRDQMRSLFSTQKLAINTVIVFLCYMSLGFADTLWSGFLNSYLSRKGVSLGDGSIENTYETFAYQSACGVPGSILAAFLVQFRMVGRKIALCIFGLMTGAFLFGIASASTAPAVNGITSIIGFTDTGMYGVLYAYAPEIFPTPVRATADSMCAFLQRVMGLFAGIVSVWSSGGASLNGPVYASAALFVFAGVLGILLPIETLGTTAL